MDGQTQHAAARMDPCLPKLQIICASNLDVNQLIYGWDNKGSSLNDQPTTKRRFFVNVLDVVNFQTLH